MCLDFAKLGIPLTWPVTIEDIWQTLNKKMVQNLRFVKLINTIVELV